MGFDVSTLDAVEKRLEEGIPVKILHPANGAELGITITVASYESERVKRVVRELGNRQLLAQKRNPKRADTVEALEERVLDIAVAAIIGWDGVELNGQVLPFTRENARMLLSKYPFIAEQLDQAAGDRAAFFGA